MSHITDTPRDVKPRLHYLIKPWQHQERAIEFARSAPDLALFFEMGTGKTGTAINILRERFGENKRLMRTLILGPVITIRNWVREFGLHSQINGRLIVPLEGPQKKRVDRFSAEALELPAQTLTKGCIFITNYEAMEMERLVEMIHAWRPEILICDESHRLKNPKSKRAKAVVGIADQADHRYILTGTPILNSAMDVFNQFRILDSGETFGRDFYAFRGRYFEDKNAKMPSHIHFPNFVERPTTYQELNKKIYTKALRVLKSECLDLPPLVRTRLILPLGEDQARIYKEMQKDYIAWINTKKAGGEPRAVIAQMAITKALRLQQIASGYAKTEDGAEIPIHDNPRLGALSDLLEELTPNHKVIVWATFHENYRQIAKVCEGLKINYVELHGGISARAKNENIDRFQTDDACRVVIGNQGAAGIGINLTQSSYSIFYSRNFSLEHDLQAESRNYRGGSEIHEKVTRLDLVAAGTIDELILEALANKLNISEQILNWQL